MKQIFNYQFTKISTKVNLLSNQKNQLLVKNILFIKSKRKINTKNKIASSAYCEKKRCCIRLITTKKIFNPKQPTQTPF